jgi:hypothetical protein
MTHTCDASYSTRVYVDGNQSDWESEVEPTERVMQLVAGEFRYDWTGPNDASFMLWCRESDNAFYFAIVGRDNELVEPQGGTAGDRLELYFDAPQPNGGSRRLAMRVPVYPAANDQPTEVLWLEGGQRGENVPAARADVVRRTHGNGQGYFLEVLIPRTAMNTEFGVAPIPFAAVYRDYDGDQRREQEVGIATAPFDGSEPSEMGVLERGLIDVRLRAFREQQAIPQDMEPELVHYKNVGGNGQLEYVALVDNHLVVIGNGLGQYDNASFPVEVVEDQENESLEFRDLDFDNDYEIIHRIRLSREDIETETTVHQRIMGIYDVDGQGLNRVALQEYGVEIEGEGLALSEPDFVDRPEMIITLFPKPRRTDLDQSNWIDIDADIDVEYRPMLPPWSDKRHIIYYPMGNSWQSRTE